MVVRADSNLSTNWHQRVVCRVAEQTLFTRHDRYPYMNKMKERHSFSDHCVCVDVSVKELAAQHKKLPLMLRDDAGAAAAQLGNQK